VAAHYYTAAVAIRPKSPEAHSSLGVALCPIQLDQGVAELRESIRVKPHSAFAHMWLAISLREQRKFAEVVTEYREALRLEPGSLWAQNGLGAALLCLGKIDEAVAEYRELARQKPADPSGHAALAYALALAPNRPRHEYDESLIHARRAAQAKPDEFNVIGTLALAEYRAGHWSESLAAAGRWLGLSAAVAQTPAARKGDNAETLFAKAFAHWHQGEKEQARAAFDQAADFAKKYPTPEADIVRRIRNEAAVVLGRAKRNW
jgi:tetratricopeptide (TPR) repeat protein